jgi:hypothetical protein
MVYHAWSIDRASAHQISSALDKKDILAVTYLIQRARPNGHPR